MAVMRWRIRASMREGNQTYLGHLLNQFDRHAEPLRPPPGCF